MFISDLKPDNIGFLEDGTLKLFDLGLATCIYQSSIENEQQDHRISQEYQMTGCTGSLRYMAPETALQQPYNEKIDVYSYGILFWQMGQDKIPFQGYDQEKFYHNVIHGMERPKLDSSWPEALNLLLRQRWQFSIDERPSFAMIVKSLEEIIFTQQQQSSSHFFHHTHSSSATSFSPTAQDKRRNYIQDWSRNSSGSLSSLMTSKSASSSWF
jgi:hypothetical protein